MNKTENNPESPKAAPTYQNQARLIGFLGDKPVQHGNRATFSLATKTSWPVKGTDKWEHHTEWHRIVAWDKLAEAVKSLDKGAYLEIDGEIRSSERNDLHRLHDGAWTLVKVRCSEIRARAVRKLDRTPKPAEQPAQKPTKAKPVKAAA